VGGESCRPQPLLRHGNLDRPGRRTMTFELAQVAAGWPLGLSLAAAASARGLRAGRRRTALNEAMHELRRPLQALALAAPAAAGPAGVESSLQMAAVALERLDREINGGPAAPIPVEPLAGAAVGRWKARAALAGGLLELRWLAGEAIVAGDRCDLSRALDNLIVNAIEHGGPAIAVVASRHGGQLRVAVTDSGRASRPPSRRESPAELIARLSGRRRNGHGLRVVRRIAALHGGDFQLRCSERATEAVLELPLLGGEGGAGR
jgi:signal transduction histidine kinase